MYVDESIEFINSLGVVVRFDGAPFGLVSIEGLGDVEAEIQQQKAPYQDGTTFIDSVLVPRYIPVEFIIRGENYGEVKNHRQYLSNALNPKLGIGTLRYMSGDTLKEIKAVAESVPVYADRESRGERWQRGLFTFIAPNPYWKSVEMTSEPMTAYIGLFEFPFQFPVEFGTVGGKQTFYNEGDVPAPVQIEFRGPATNPRVTNHTTGEFIQVNRELQEGESLIVNTEFGNKRVEIEGMNVINWIDPNSTFWQLVPGQNEIEYTADAGRENAVVGITWRNHYVGV